MIEKLRSCNAYVNNETNGFCHTFELVSYSTPVALLGYVEGEFIDDFGETHTHDGWALMLSDDWDYSVTTQSHVRNFIEDYIGTTVSSALIRHALKTDNELYMNVNVYRCSWA